MNSFFLSAMGSNKDILNKKPLNIVIFNLIFKENLLILTLSRVEGVKKLH